MIDCIQAWHGQHGSLGHSVYGGLRLANNAKLRCIVDNRSALPTYTCLFFRQCEARRLYAIIEQRFQLFVDTHPQPAIVDTIRPIELL